MSIYGTGDTSKYWTTPLSGGGADPRPFTVSLWMWSENGVGLNASVALTAGSDTPRTVLCTDGSGSMVRFGDYDGTNYGEADLTFAVPGAGVWRHIIGLSANSSARWAGGDGDLFQDTTFVNPLPLTTLLVGLSPGTSAFATGAQSKLAEVAYFNRALTGPEIRTLANGASPLRITGLRHYYPLRDNLLGYAHPKTGLVPVGGAVALYGDHPPVDPLPTRRSMSLFSAAATQPPANTSPTIWWT